MAVKLFSLVKRMKQKRRYKW